MPFTPSHAVVALPFIRTPLVPAAIAIGAMTPDLPLFIRTDLPAYDFTHDLRSLPVTVVLALGLLLVWRCLLRPAAAELSPRWLAARLPSEWAAAPVRAFRETFGADEGERTARSVALLAASLVLGVMSHIVWDLFTHDGRGGVQLIPALAQQWGPLPGYKWAQHGSSVAGLVILGVWGAGWLRHRRPAAVGRMLPSVLRWAWWASLPLVLVAAWLVGLSLYGPIGRDMTVQQMAYQVFPHAVGAWGAATLLLAAVVTTIRSLAPSPR